MQQLVVSQAPEPIEPLAVRKANAEFKQQKKQVKQRIQVRSFSCDAFALGFTGNSARNRQPEISKSKEDHEEEPPQITGPRKRSAHVQIQRKSRRNIFEREQGYLKTYKNCMSFDDWLTVLEKQGFSESQHKRVLQSLKHGIPSKLRGSIWMIISGSLHLRDSFRAGTTSRLRDILFVSDFYNDLKNFLPCDAIVQIDKDIPRTFFTELEEDQRFQLKNILTAYANLDIEVKYCQGKFGQEWPGSRLSFDVLTLLCRHELRCCHASDPRHVRRAHFLGVFLCHAEP